MLSCEFTTRWIANHPEHINRRRVAALRWRHAPALAAQIVRNCTKEAELSEVKPLGTSSHLHLGQASRSRPATAFCTHALKTTDHNLNLITRHGGSTIVFPRHEILQPAQPNYGAAKSASALIYIYITQSPIILMAVETPKTISGAKRKWGERERKTPGGRGCSDWAEVELMSVRIKKRPCEMHLASDSSGSPP